MSADEQTNVVCPLLFVQSHYDAETAREAMHDVLARIRLFERAGA
jgi:hypothetical protein